jgi:hypothetical protein
LLPCFAPRKERRQDIANKKDGVDSYWRGLKMRIKGLVLLGVMIAATIFYLFAGNLKGCTGTRVGDPPAQDSRTVAPEKR